MKIMNPVTKAPHSPWRIAHRGAQDQAPENTRSAFERALACGVDGIELDVQMSADGMPVIFHDPSLYRIARRRKSVAELSYAELSQLDWGGWFGPSFKGEPLMTLAQTLSLLAQRTRLLIEIKVHPKERASGHAQRLTEKVIDLLKTTRPRPQEANMHILSFDEGVLSLAHGLAPQWRYILNLAQNRPDAVMQRPPEAFRHLWAVDVRIGNLSAPLVQWARSRELRVFTYTCNTPTQVAKALDLGVDAILTDRPAWLTRHLKKRP